jgi:predicted Zn finger-like uncharacterized protein
MKIRNNRERFRRMRLICPNCDAQYEVDDGAIPEAGRDVQCSNCGHAWFQIREVLADTLADDLYRDPVPEPVSKMPAALAQSDEADDAADDEDAPPPPPVGRAPVQRTLDESVLAVLREEAERELAARKAEAASGLEMQGDLGLPPPVSPVVGSAAEAHHDDGRDVGHEEPAPDGASGDAKRRVAMMKGMAVPPPRPAARRDLLPDIEEINSSLRPTEAADHTKEASEAAEKSSGSGFGSGFLLMLMIAGLAIAVYLMAPKISVQFPAAAGAMAAYVDVVDAFRATVDGLMRRATGALNGTAGS